MATKAQRNVTKSVTTLFAYKCTTVLRILIRVDLSEYLEYGYLKEGHCVLWSVVDEKVLVDWNKCNIFDLPT